MTHQCRFMERAAYIGCAMALAVVGMAAPGAQAEPAQPTAAPDPAWNVYGAPQRLVKLADGRAMNIYCIGRGSPTVVLDAGLGDSAVVWRKVHTQLAKRSQVCAFDRAGSGFSDPGPMPRDAVHIAQDMQALFTVAGLKPPYVLVGHSLAGLTVRYYADLHLDEVAGMVLVEPATEHQDKRIVKVVPALGALFDQQRAVMQACLDRLEGKGKRNPEVEQFCAAMPTPDLPPAANAVAAKLNGKPYHLRSMLSELDGMLGPSSDQAAAARRSYGAIPLIVLTAGNPMLPGLSASDQEAVLKVIKHMHGEQAALSSRGGDRVVPDSGHYVQLDQPKAVIDAVSEVLAAVKVK
jgi:pimeloyl-ACP methyl ester carboxylesterase